MAIVNIPEKEITLTKVSEIQNFLKRNGIVYEYWETKGEIPNYFTQEEILDVYRSKLQPFMENGGYKNADVISINENTENYTEIRKKFLAEHTHTEDEIRFFVDGQGLFWFHLDGEPIFNVLCQKGDLISVPVGYKHWFDAGVQNPHVKCIRIFSDTSGWTPVYTESKVEKRFERYSL